MTPLSIIKQSLKATSHYLSYNPTLNTNYFNDRQTDRRVAGRNGTTDGWPDYFSCYSITYHQSPEKYICLPGCCCMPC